MPLLWPIHPRARKQLETFGLWGDVVNTPNLIPMQAIGYHEILRLLMTSKIVLTESGGLQGETVALNVPCLIQREHTEWVVTLEENGDSSKLVGNTISEIRKEFRKSISNTSNGIIPELWDGNTAQRCLETLANSLSCIFANLYYFLDAIVDNLLLYFPRA